MVSIRAICVFALATVAAGLTAPPLARGAVLRAYASPLVSAAAAAPRAGALAMQEKELGVRAGLVNEVPFEVRFSIGNVVSISGGVLLTYCLVSYLFSNGQADIIQTLGFVYAIPALVGGLALKYAELPPVPLTANGATPEEFEVIREAKGTKIQKKILSDATRYTYGDVRNAPRAFLNAPS